MGLYINDSTWSLNYAILKVEDGPIKTSTTIAYYDKENDINIPITFYNDIVFNVLPYEGNIKYYSGLNYFQILSNENLPVHKNITRVSKPTANHPLSVLASSYRNKFVSSLANA